MKSVLKKIFPIKWLKQAFLFYNYVKINSFDKVFFKEATIPRELYSFKYEKNPFTELNISTESFPNTIKKGFERWIDPQWSQDEYLLNYSQVGYLEPRIGWGVSMKNRLIYPSLGFAFAPHVHKPNFFDTYFKKRKATKLGKIISLRDTGEENYFHFYNDVLPKIFLLQEHAIAIENYTLVISEGLYSKKYFQFFLKDSFLSKLKWYVQKSDEWIQFEEAIFCKPYTHTKKYFDKCISIAKPMSSLVADRKLFLTRSNKSLRFIQNMDEVVKVLEQYNFEIVDTEFMGFEQQVVLFNQCRYLIAIHGAGISNILFRSPHPMTLLEIVHPNPYIPFHYIMLSKLYGYSYDVLLGKKSSMSSYGGFEISTSELESCIVRMLKTK